MKLSILIPTIVGREGLYDSIVKSLSDQYNGTEVEICTLKDNREMLIGDKRNQLLRMANGEYVAYVDDDDMVSDNYIQLVMGGIERDVDCCSLVGEITFDGLNPKKFIHSLDYTEWFEKGNIYYRSVNHLNCIKTSIARQIGFPQKNHGEDYDYSMALKLSGLLKTEHKIEQTIYYYNYISNK